jgi:hypothetical protein
VSLNITNRNIQEALPQFAIWCHATW